MAKNVGDLSKIILLITPPTTIPKMASHVQSVAVQAANELWKTGDFAEDFIPDDDGIDVEKTPRVSFSGTHQIAEIPIEDAAPISPPTFRNCFPFSDGTNELIQTVDYTFDLYERYPEMNPATIREIIDHNGGLDTIAVEKSDLQTIIANARNGNEYEFEVGFKVGKVVVALSPDGNSLAMIAWHKDNENISVINLVGKCVRTGQLPDLPPDWVWSGAKFSDDFTLALQIYNNKLDIYSTLTCSVSLPQ